MRAAFYTLGCKVNQYETQILMQNFSALGYDIVDAEQQADIYVVNSCTVTASGDKKTRQIMRRFRRENPAAKIVLTGCFPQAFPNAAAMLPEADVITGSYNRAGLIAALQRCLATGERVVDITPHKRGETFESMKAEGFYEHTRAFVKIQDGCERYCSYCIIPTARGPVRSKPLDAIKDELARLARQGYKEAVLVGINLSCYGSDINLRLIDAVEAACDIHGIERVRLGSLEPELLTDGDIIRLSQMDKLCPQFHLSLQSGCDATLKRMNRHYDTVEYTRIVDSLRRHFENPAITTDIMVGFPGESDEEFEQSLQFAKNIGFAQAHIFAYSRRDGTAAAKMPNQVPQSVKAKRAELMAMAAAELKQSFLKSQIGRTEQVMFENTQNELGTEGYTKNYTPVCVRSQHDIRRKLLTVKITGAGGDFCTGEIV
ncbi:MAG TPA: tRNA (N(6)-L-threonylcarbamoyladenosine(37)-C(2))-methylthiotransferase MtaB [Ruminococcaceae bacterium]|nr:tRNA (N(6)-L-threonylcarbamoyladenosine(37)-C(2))-methylthiotransferase MtaB [Oscillospiraceae bacterium]